MLNLSADELLTTTSGAGYPTRAATASEEEMSMWLNELRNLWDRGDAAVGVWTTSGSAVVVECMALSQPDFVVVDAQHGFMGPDAVRACLLALARTTTTALVRTPSSDPAFIGQVLDAGAHGVIVPMVESPDDARRAVAACRFPPVGQRSFGPVRAAQSLGRDPSVLGGEVLCIPMIETVVGVENAEEIVAVPGVDSVCVGPADLAISLGLSPDLGQPPGVHLESIARIRNACTERGIPCGIACVDGQAARQMILEGFNMVSIGSDLQLVGASCRAHLAVAREGTAPVARGVSAVQNKALPN